MVAPTLVLWFYFLALGFASEVAHDNLPKRADLAASVGFGLIISYWVISDARKRGRTLCYDYDSFVYFAWYFVVPVYLFRTRGPRAFLTMLGAFGMCFGMNILGAAVASLGQGMLR